MRSVVVTTLLASALSASCTRGKPENQPCVDELTAIIVPALDRTFDGGDADAFHRDTKKLSEEATMCGPDIAQALRDWEVALREPDAAKASASRRAVLARLGELVDNNEMKAEAKALAGLLARARTK
ncbi:MAG TPA: hypothetical protein VIV40_19785 [Kofleriaceae bacterium]